MIWRWIRRGAQTQEAASAYLDGELSPRRADAFRRKLHASPDLQTYVEELRETRCLLRELPEAVPARTLTLSAAQAARLRNPRRAPRALPAARTQTGLRAAVAFSTVAAAALLAVVAVDLTEGDSTPAAGIVEQSLAALPQANPDGARSTDSPRPAPSSASATPARTADSTTQETPVVRGAAPAPVAEPQEAAVAAMPAREPDADPEMETAPETIAATETDAVTEADGATDADGAAETDAVKPPTDAASIEATIPAREETPESEDGADAAQADGSAKAASETATITIAAPVPSDQPTGDQASSDQATTVEPAPDDQATVEPSSDGVSSEATTEETTETSTPAMPPSTAPTPPAADADAAGHSSASRANSEATPTGPVPDPSPADDTRSIPQTPQPEVQPALATVVGGSDGSDADLLLALEIGLGLLLGLGLGAAMWQGLRRT